MGGLPEIDVADKESRSEQRLPERDHLVRVPQDRCCQNAEEEHCK
jgi:hypothetical protein